MFGDLRDPGQSAATVFLLSYAAKLYISFGVRAPMAMKGATSAHDYEVLDEDMKERYILVSKAQLNVAEYDAIVFPVLLFLYSQSVGGVMVMIVSILLPLASAVYFWGHVLSGKPMPWTPLGVMPRYLVGIPLMIYLVATNVGGQFFGDLRDPGQSAVAILFLSYAAKLYMSFGVRARMATKGAKTSHDYDVLGEDFKEKAINASKAQLNVVEYEGIFLPALLFFYTQGAGGVLVQIVGIVAPLAQAVYFWGRTLSGNVSPWNVVGTLPRYASMGIMIYVLATHVGGQFFGDLRDPGQSAVALLFVSLTSKLYMSFVVRLSNDTSDKAAEASKAQLNIAEYENVLLPSLLFLCSQGAGGVLVVIVSILLPLAQAVYFWGRALSGKPMPWTPLGAMPRYITMGIMTYLLFVAVSE